MPPTCSLRKLVYVIFAFVQPVMFVLLFRFVFGGAIDTGDVDNVDIQKPGIIVQTAVFGAPMTGFRPSEPVWSIAFALLIVLAFSYTFSWTSAFVGLPIKDPETAQSAGFIWVFPLTFVSSAFVPVDSMPDWLEAFANINPITLVVDTVRALMIGEGDVTGPLLGTTAWLVGLLAVFVPLSMRAFRRA